MAAVVRVQSARASRYIDTDEDVMAQIFAELRGYRKPGCDVKEATLMLDDIRRYLRAQDPHDRDVSKKLGEWDVVQQDLVPLLIYYMDEAKVAGAIVKILVLLTLPPTEAEFSAQEQNYLRMHKRAMCRPGAITALVARIAEPLQHHSRLDKEDRAIELTLTLVRNMLRVPDAPVASAAATSLAAAAADSLQERFILTLAEEHFGDLLVVVSQDLHPENHAHWPFLIAEIMLLAVRGETAASLHASGAEDEEEEERVRAWEDARSRQEMMQRKDREERRRAAVMSRRHARFGGTFVTRTAVGTNVVKNRDMRALREVRLEGSRTMTRKKAKVTPTVGNPISAGIGGGGDGGAGSGASGARSSYALRNALFNLCRSFLESAYNPVMEGFKRAFDRDAGVMDNDPAVYAWLASFMMEFHRHEQASARMEAESRGAGHDFDIAPIAATISDSTFAWAFKWLSVFCDDTARGSKSRMYMEYVVAMLREMFMVLDEMRACKGGSDRFAQNLLLFAFQEGPLFDKIPSLIRGFNARTHKARYLTSLVELSHVMLKILDKFTKENVTVQRVVKVKKHESKGKSKRDPIEDMTPREYAEYLVSHIVGQAVSAAEVFRAARVQKEADEKEEEERKAREMEEDGDVEAGEKNRKGKGGAAAAASGDGENDGEKAADNGPAMVVDAVTGLLVPAQRDQDQGGSDDGDNKSDGDGNDRMEDIDANADAAANVTNADVNADAMDDGVEMSQEKEKETGKDGASGDGGDHQAEPTVTVDADDDHQETPAVDLDDGGDGDETTAAKDKVVADEEGMEEEDEEEVRTEYLERTVSFTADEFLHKLNHAPIVARYLELLENYRRNDPQTNRHVVKLFSRLMRIEGNMPLFYQAALLHLCERVLNDPVTAADKQRYGDLRAMAEYVGRKFFAAAQANHDMYVEALFWKSRNLCLEMTYAAEGRPMEDLPTNGAGGRAKGKRGKKGKGSPSKSAAEGEEGDRPEGEPVDGEDPTATTPKRRSYRKWTTAEDTALLDGLRLVRSLPRDELAGALVAFVAGRTPRQVVNRLKKLLPGDELLTGLRVKRSAPAAAKRKNKDKKGGKDKGKGKGKGKGRRRSYGSGSSATDSYASGESDPAGSYYSSAVSSSGGRGGGADAGGEMGPSGEFARENGAESGSVPRERENGVDAEALRAEVEPLIVELMAHEAGAIGVRWLTEQLLRLADIRQEDDRRAWADHALVPVSRFHMQCMTFASFLGLLATLGFRPPVDGEIYHRLGPDYSPSYLRSTAAVIGSYSRADDEAAPGAAAPATSNIAGRGRRRRERAERAERADVVARLGGTRRTVALRRHASSDTDEMIVLDDDTNNDNNNDHNGVDIDDEIDDEIDGKDGNGGGVSKSTAGPGAAPPARVRQRASDLPFGSDIGRIVAASSSGGDTDDERIMDNLFGEMLGAGMDSVPDDPVAAKVAARAAAPSSALDAPAAASGGKRPQAVDDGDEPGLVRPAKRGRVIIDSDDE